MNVDVIASAGKVLVDVEKATPCCLTLEPSEAIDFAAKLLSAAISAKAAAEFDATRVSPW